MYFIRATTWFFMFNERSAMRLLTVSFDSETDCSFEATLSSHASLAMSMAAGFTSLSPIVCGFISLPMCSETTYDASAACLEAKSAGFLSEQILLHTSSVSRFLKKMRVFFTCCGCFAFKCLFNLFFFRDSLDSTL